MRKIGQIAGSLSRRIRAHSLSLFRKKEQIEINSRWIKYNVQRFQTGSPFWHTIFCYACHPSCSKILPKESFRNFSLLPSTLMGLNIAERVRCIFTLCESMSTSWTASMVRLNSWPSNSCCFLWTVCSARCLNEDCSSSRIRSYVKQNRGTTLA